MSKEYKVEDNILAVSNVIFKSTYRKYWYMVTEEMKKKYWFIMNRYFSKKYFEYAQFLNDKIVDEVMCMNLLFAFFENKPYPKWFWSKSEKKADKSLFIEKDLLLLCKKFDIKESEMEILVEFHPDEIKEEIKYIKSQIEK